MKKNHPLIMILILLLSLSICGFALSQTGDLSSILNAFSVDSVIGQPRQIGDMTIIPVFSAGVSFGYYSSGTKGEITGSGSGGTSEFLPFALIIIDSENVRIVPVTNKSNVFSQFIDSLPKLIPVIRQLLAYFSIDSKSTATPENILELEPYRVTETPEPEKLQKEDRISILYDSVGEESSIEVFRLMYEEVKQLLPTAMENPKAHALSGYLTMRLLEKASPLQQIRMAMEAQREIDKALELDPDDILGLISKGWMNVYNPAGKLEVAIECFEKALTIEPENVNALMGIITSYDKAKKTELVEEWAKKAMQLYPDNAFFSSFVH